MDGTTPNTPSPGSVLLRSLDREQSFEPLTIEGTIPESLEGTLYRVGPGSFDSLGVRVSHLFEADGAVTAVSFSGGRARGAVRLVETKSIREERKAGVPLYGPRASYPRRLLATLAGKTKNAANTAPMVFQNRLFALFEGGTATEIDPETLATVGEATFGGVAPVAFSAHPHRVEKRKALYNFGVRYGRTTKLDLFELPDAGDARRLGTIPLPKPVMLHDFIATESRLLFFVSPFEVVLPRMLLQLGTFEDYFRWHEEHGTEVIVVPIDAPERVARFRVPAFFQWHYANAFDDGDTTLVDFVRFADASSFRGVGLDKPLGSDLLRVRVDPARASVTDVSKTEGIFEFPSVDPRVTGSRHRQVFTIHESATTRGIARHDRETGEVDSFVDGLHTWFSEPVFAPRRGGREGEGHLVSLVVDVRDQRTHVAIFDAERVRNGPIARAYFDRMLPITFHGTFRSNEG